MVHGAATVGAWWWCVFALKWKILPLKMMILGRPGGTSKVGTASVGKRATVVAAGFVAVCVVVVVIGVPLVGLMGWAGLETPDAELRRA